MDFSGGISSGAIVRCFGCTNWVRIYASECVNTSEGGETYHLHRWCFGCLAEVEDMTAEAMKQFSDYPEGLAPWDKSDEDEEGDDDEKEDKPSDSDDDNTGD